MSKLINTLKKISPIKILQYIIRVTGYIFIVIGQGLIGDKRKHRVVTELIENLLTSVDAHINVENISEYSLYTKFKVHVKSVNKHTIDWNFYHLELMYQLGCMLSDIHLESLAHESFREGTHYNIDITHTAITNFEKGMGNFPPSLFTEQNTEALFKSAYILSQKEELTVENIKNKLNIDDLRAFYLHNQLKKSPINTTTKDKKKVN